MRERRDPPLSGCDWPGRPGTEMLALYEERLAAFQDRLVATLGSHTARVLLHRAIWQVVSPHPVLHLIHHGECDLCCEVLQKSDATRLDEEIAIEAAFNDLVAETLRILARFLGREMACVIAAQSVREAAARDQSGSPATFSALGTPR